MKPSLLMSLAVLLLVAALCGGAADAADVVTNPIQNGGFEQPNDSGPWFASLTYSGQPAIGVDIRSDTAKLATGGASPHAGSYAAWPSQWQNAQIDVLQEITIPSNALTLSYWTWITSDESTCDTVNKNGAWVFFATAQWNQLESYPLCKSNITNGWQKRTLNVSSFRGQTGWLDFTSRTLGLASGLFIDDVTIELADNPIPAIASLNPSTVAAGRSALTLAVSGTGFVPTSTVRWNGSDRATSYLSSTSLTATIPAGDVATTGTASVTVFNPPPGGGSSNPKNLIVNSQVYLPVLSKPTPGIWGRVTLNGAPVGGVPLLLRFFNGTLYSTAATTSTATDGSYSFTNAPTLGSGQWYYVLFLNSTNGPETVLWSWSTRRLTTFSAGSSVAIGDFDIANIPLVAPAPNATVGLPYTFLWTRRPATPSDSYELDLFDPSDNNPWWWTYPLLNYANNYTLYGLPSGFVPNVMYGWDVCVFSPDGGMGVSRYYQSVTFSNSGLSGLAPQNAEPRRDTVRRGLDPIIGRHWQ